MRKKGKVIIVILLLLSGIGILIYPTLSDYVNSLDSSFAIRDLSSQLAEIADGELEQHRRLAEDYNAGIISGKPDTSRYEEILNFGSGLMGHIQIPTIDVNLPIYHGVSEETLSKGIGHMPQTAFPIGGTGNHAVLTGHTGLPSAELFTDLTELQEGDVFYIHILEETLAYRVDQIQVVLPSEAEALVPIPGGDYCTLVTCTPYGINSHRLLVRGSRIELTQEEAVNLLPQDDVPEIKTPPALIAAAAAAGVLLVCLIVVIFKREK